MHKKRVMAVKEFLHAHAEGSNDGPVSRLMLITGEPCCKAGLTVHNYKQCKLGLLLESGHYCLVDDLFDRVGNRILH